MEDKAEAGKPEGQFVGGEVRILADAGTGAISVSAPQNLLVALGMLEMAKVVMVAQHQEAVRAAERPAIVRPGSADLAKVARPS